MNQGRPNQALEQTRDSVLRYGEVVGCELLNFFVLPKLCPYEIRSCDRPQMHACCWVVGRAGVGRPAKLRR